MKTNHDNNDDDYSDEDDNEDGYGGSYDNDEGKMMMTMVIILGWKLDHLQLPPPDSNENQPTRKLETNAQVLVHDLLPGL